jgi:hypothetical protein
MSVDVETIRGQIERIINSKSFETSEVHRRLIQYLAEKSITGEADRLKEYTIGLEAFAKPSSYDPKHDSIVRLQIGRLRQKLAAYYQTEAAADDILVSLPKGAFKLNFDPMPSHDQAAPPQVSSRWRAWWLPVALALVTVWAILATIYAVRLHKDAEVVAERWSPELESIWAPVLQSNRSLLICLGAPLFVRFPEFGFFRDPKANDLAEIDKSDRIAAGRKAFQDRNPIPVYPFIGAGDASAAIVLSQLLATRKRTVSLTRSNVLSWQQIADHDVIFVGPPKFNLQLQSTAFNQDIVFEPNGIRNRNPQAGDPVFLEDHIIVGNQSEGETHALISLTPGPNGVGVLWVIAGNASPDSFAAAEWLTQPWHAKELCQRLRNSSGELPKYYQVVLKVEFKQGTPVKTSYVFHHVVNPGTPKTGTR